jgi:hypothetical protein
MNRSEALKKLMSNKEIMHFSTAEDVEFLDAGWGAGRSEEEEIHS